MEKEVIMYFIGFLICLINMTWIYTNINDKAYNLKAKSLFLMSLLSVIATYINNFNITILNMLSSMFFVFIIIKIIYKEELKKAIFYSLFIWGFGMLFDFIFMSIFSFFSKFLIDYMHIIQYVTTYILQMLYNLISRISIFKILSKKLYDIFNKISLIVMLFLIIDLAYLGSKAILNVNDLNKTILLFVLGILITVVIIEYVVIRYLKIVYKETNNILLKNNKIYIELNQETRKFKHNLIHKLDGLNLYANQKTKMLINEVISDSNKLASTNTEVDKLPNGINGLIHQKLHKYRENNLNILVDNSFNKDILDVLKPRQFNKLCEVIGVTLDNALEAAIKTKDKIIYIFVEETNEDIEIIIKNSFSSFLEIDSLGAINYTTKGKSHGIGLFSILFVKSIRTKINIVNDLFVTKILVKKTN